MSTSAVSKKVRASAKLADHPPFKTMIESAVVALSAGRQKASRQAIHKHIFANNLTVEDNAANCKHINRALARMATSGAITRKSGTGASGSFRPAPKAVKPAGEINKKKKVVKKTSTPTKKKASTKKPSVKKQTTKSPAKKTTKSPAKKTTKPKSPAKKAAAKKKVLAVKKAGAEKATAKKVVTKKAPSKK